MQPDHLADDVLSALVDGQLSPDDFSRAHAHLGTCSVCQARLGELEALVGLLRALPTVEPPRDFQLGPRLVVDPPNVIRLRRWYAWSRAGAGALAAAFVFLSVGTLYVDSRPATNPSAAQALKAQPAAPELAPGPQNPSVPASQNPSVPAPQNPSVSTPRNLAAPAARNAAGTAANDAAAPTSPASTEPGDQIAAATTVRPLPTQVPTAVRGAQPPIAIVSQPVTQQQTDPAAPWRIAAALVGVLAAFGILLALFIRHRLGAVSPSHLE